MLVPRGQQGDSIFNRVGKKMPIPQGSYQAQPMQHPQQQQQQQQSNPMPSMGMNVAQQYMQGGSIFGGGAGAGAGASSVAGTGAAGAGGASTATMGMGATTAIAPTAGAAGASAGGGAASGMMGGMAAAGPWAALGAAIVGNELMAKKGGHRREGSDYYKDLASGAVMNQDFAQRWLPKIGLKEGSTMNKVISASLNPLGAIFK